MDTRRNRVSRADFQVWLQKVDRAVLRLIDLSLFDLPDCPYWEWWAEERLSPKAAARRAVGECGL